MTDQEYKEAVEWLFVQAPNYQTDGIRAYKPGLQNITALCEYFGNPQQSLQMVHIGGTNGKGSTSNMLASVLQEAGYKTGLYNSPHLIDFTERIKVNGKNAAREFVFEFINKLKNLPPEIRPSFFEFTTVMAFEYFRQQQVDIAIIEVGLGGRLDSTNIITPILTTITNVALDHMNILGDTVEEIAKEKGGIIKKNIPFICGEENPAIRSIIQQMAQQQDAPFTDATQDHGDYESDLQGSYQKKNVRVVSALVQELKKLGFDISDEVFRNGLLHVQKNTGFLGRWYVFETDPLTICDTAHNMAGLQEVFAQLNTMPMKKHIVLGFVKDKKIEEVLQILPRNASYYFVKPSLNRGRHPQDYQDLLQQSGAEFVIFDTVDEGYTAAKNNCAAGEMIFVGGSNFVVGEFLEKNLEK